MSSRSQEDGQRADVHGVGPEPDQVRIEPRQLRKQHAYPLRLVGNRELQELFDRQAVAQVVVHWAQVVDAVGQRHHLLVKLGFAGLLDAGVQIADLRIEPDDDFSVDFQHQSQDSVRGRVLRAHIQNHRLVA
jgi:hypothetical protein